MLKQYVLVLQVLRSSWSTRVTRSYMGYPYSPTIPPRFCRSYLVYMSLYYRYYSVPDLHQRHRATWDIPTAPRYNPGSTAHISYIIMSLYYRYYPVPDLHQWHRATWDLPTAPRYNPGSTAHISYICHCTTGITQFLIYTSDTELHGISLQPHDTTQVLPLISRIYVIVLQVLLSSWSTPATRSYMGYPYSPTIPPRFYRSYLVYMSLYYRYYAVPDLHEWHRATWDIPTAPRYHPGSTAHISYYVVYMSLYYRYYTAPDLHQWHRATWDIPTAPRYHPGSTAHISYICHCTTGITQFLIYTSDTELHGISLQPHDTTQVLPLISRIYVIVLQVLLSSWSTPVTRSYMGYPYSPMIPPRFYRSYLVLCCICHCTTGITQFLIYTSDTELHGISLQPHDTTQVLPLISRIYVIVLQVLPSSWSTPVTRSYMGSPYSPTIPPRFYHLYLVYMSLYYRYYSVPDLHEWHGATWDIPTAPRYHPGSTAHISYICHCTTGITQFLIYTSDTELHGISLQPHDTTQVLPLISRI